MKQIAILGCGPSGLLAAHAAKLMGHRVTIFSKKQRSQMRGAQYMHVSIPELTLDAPAKLAYILQGDINAYRAKVYGDNIHDDLTVSPELFTGYHEAWNIRQAYHQLWDMYKDRIVNCHIDGPLLQRLMHGEFDVCLATVPAPLLCHQDHRFDSVKVWIDNTWHGTDPSLNPQRYGTSNVVLCNGQAYDEDHVRQTGWYRTSIIYNHANTEWIAKSAAIPREAKPIIKPLRTDCNCWPRIARAGRYGEWRKGVLSHHAFETALEVFA